MPRYHFNSGDWYDEDGTEFATLEAAKCGAVAMAGQLLGDEAGEFWDNAVRLMTVTDERGHSLFQVQICGVECQPSLGASLPALV